MKTVADPIGAEAEELLRSLSPQEQDELYAHIFGYKSVPVDIDTFIEDPYFLGSILRDEVTGDISLWPCWRGALREIYPNPFFSPYTEIIVTGAIGIGKSTFASVGNAYDLYRLLELSTPHSVFKLLPTTKIEFAVVNATLDLSKKTTFDQLSGMLASSPYFKKKMAEAKAMPGNHALFPNRIDFKIGSRLRAILGQAVYNALLEEMNFQDVVGGQAMENYTGARRRMQSRFIQEGGRLPGHIWLVSSVTGQESFLESVIENAKDDPTSRVFSFAIWEAYEGTDKVKFSGDTFRVYLGSSLRDPFMIEDAEANLAGLEPESIISVPVEYRKDFKFNLVESIRDYAGRPTMDHMKLFPSVEQLRGTFSGINIFTKETFQLPFDGPGAIKDVTQWRAYLKMRENPSRIRYVHLDMALSGDRLGLAIATVAGYQTVERRKLDGHPLQVSRWRLPIIQIEGAIGLEAIPGSEIPLFKVREFLKELFDNGVHVSVTSDLHHMSADTRQLLHLMGIEADYQSVDKTKEPYICLRTALMEGRLLGPKNEMLIGELTKLFDNGKMYDHPPNGSKDVADAVAGACFALTMDERSGEDRLRQLEEFHDATVRVEKSSAAILDTFEGFKNARKNRRQL